MVPEGRVHHGGEAGMMVRASLLSMNTASNWGPRVQIHKPLWVFLFKALHTEFYSDRFLFCPLSRGLKLFYAIVIWCNNLYFF